MGRKLNIKSFAAAPELRADAAVTVMSVAYLRLECAACRQVGTATSELGTSLTHVLPGRFGKLLGLGGMFFRHLA